MAQTSQRELLRLFLEDSLQEGNAGNGHVKNNQFIHYWTPILERFGDKYIFNQTRYSLVTGQLQKYIKSIIPAEKMIIVSKVDEGYKGSLKDFIKE